jgi:hypothetical protein
MLPSCQEQEVKPMDNQPIIIHIDRMLSTFPEDPLRAVYMVVKQMYELQKPHNEISTSQYK